MARDPENPARHRDTSGLPVVAILGRPNVGKSSLFNRLVGRRIAIVDDTPGVTRDRKEAETQIAGRNILLVDTAGLEEAAPETLFGRMRASSEAALEQADVAVFVVDAKSGITASDRAFANWLRRARRPVILVANKAEGRGGAQAALEAYELGLGDPIAVSAEHNEGIAGLMEAIGEHLPEEVPEPEEGEAKLLRLAILGRPNAGKSTLLNTLLGEERMITGPEPGLTRDAIAAIFQDEAGPIRIVDTAGMRKRARITHRLEEMSVASSIAALREAEVVILVLDANLGLEEQDIRIARLAEREGRAVVIALNKWDAVEDRAAARNRIADTLETSLNQLRGIEVVTISAATGAGVDKLMPAVRRTHERWNRRIGTGALNRWFAQMLERHQLPLVDGKRLKLRYATMPKARPPTLVLFGTRAELLPLDYQRYLLNGFREEFDMPGVPIRLQLRGTENPYAEETD
ncbi:ribosome biogenesis GTPase Der [Roseococcus sp. SDR]|uniref:ribosome biogenesis GTPase Der n=1 Tax=Roseococcus sp. SDR TaxID=2835532 RepID=UPI001BCDA66A|nr:ribosome biogenesis GTPase Der [Roseococcus sp. SDR]MBS7791559.1 ribosome biogenesis GTPase Der [Roseococcus sp. SDR]MBV1846873.1 ribosome biogenesis GTPase Der [Roseococcus sp. SDR]